MRHIPVTWKIGRPKRRGAVLVETALILPVFLALVLGLLDLAGGIYRNNVMSEVARRGAREAIVHGSHAPPQRPALGPQTWNGTAADSGAVPEAIRPLLAGIDPADVAIRLEWPDGDNVAPNRVRCTVTTEYQPVTFLLSGQPMILRATSTMAIAN
jgi:hypothetical protein